jgi:hypothetical protein
MMRARCLAMIDRAVLSSAEMKRVTAGAARPYGTALIRYAITLLKEGSPSATRAFDAWVNSTKDAAERAGRTAMKSHPKWWVSDEAKPMSVKTRLQENYRDRYGG